MQRFTRVASVFAMLFAAAIGIAGAEPETPASPVSAAPPEPVFGYETDVRPVLDRRCVVCHGCYDAPCQLLLSSYDGITRGASRQPVYRSDRLHAMDPTRLFIDAKTERQWRARHFFPVVGSQGPAGGAPALLFGNPDIWRISDQSTRVLRSQRPYDAGILDLSRYENH